MSTHPVVSREAWLDARVELLEQEKALTRQRDAVAAARRALPWVRVEADYRFTGPDGEKTLAELFGDKSQLIVYHFMMGPDWREGCKSCSFWADQYDTIETHIAHRDVALAVISRAPYEVIAPFKARMGWQFRWLSSAGTSFNFDFGVSFPDQEKGYYNYREAPVVEELPGLSVFFRDDDGSVYHTYSCYSRGLDALNATYQMLDLVPRGRDEDELPYGMDWVRLHDAYD